ncbi:FtsX-like permease family protein, partial [Nocardioides sp.]|uniref:FtsX-like permease family protein n=1 Tax=Nocardioides sp. TaxID=35761 RepID=UPI002736A987
ATVAGVVALGIANASDMAEARETYQPSLPLDTGSLTYHPWEPAPESGEVRRDPAVWDRLRAVLERELAGQPVLEIHGLPVGHWPHFTAGGLDSLLDSTHSSYGAELVVAGEVPDGLGLGVPEEERSAADEVLARGGAVVFTTGQVTGDRARLVVDAEEQESKPPASVTLPAHFIDLGQHARVAGIVAPVAIEELGLEPELAGLFVDGPVAWPTEQNLRESIAAITEEASFYAERGFERDRESLMVLLVLGALGGALMLGGTLTATFLSLSDARPDLATLSAVGAAPRTRRSVAAAYALVVGGVGAALGAVVGFVPGIAVTYPLTGNSWLTEDAAGNALPTHFLDVPWLLIGVLVLVLPLLTAAIVGLTARSRLPLVARLD